MDYRHIITEQPIDYEGKLFCCFTPRWQSIPIRNLLHPAENAINGNLDSHLTSEALAFWLVRLINQLFCKWTGQTDIESIKLNLEWWDEPCKNERCFLWF